MLNDAAGVINDTIASNYPAAPGFLFATLPVYDADGIQTDANGTGTPTGTNSSDSQDTGVAM